VKAAFHEDDTNGYNVVAELPARTRRRARHARRASRLLHPGTAPRRRRRLRGHDGGLRILKAIDAKAERTVRIGLWAGRSRAARLARLRGGALRLAAGAEGGGPGRAAVVHAERPAGADHPEARTRQALRLLQLRQRTGKIRGIYLQENAAVKPSSRPGGVGEGPRGHRITMRNTAAPTTSPSTARAARLPVHPGPDRVHGRHLLRHAPHRHGHLRPAAAGGPDAGRGRDRDVRVQRGDARRAPAPQAPASGGDASGAAPGAGRQGGTRAGRSRRRRPWRPPRGPGRAERGNRRGA